MSVNGLRPPFVLRFLLGNILYIDLNNGENKVECNADIKVVKLE